MCRSSAPGRTFSATALLADACVAWHRMLNDTLAAWCADNADRFAWIGSVPLIQPEAAAQELERAGGLGACGVIISSNIENINIGELPLDAFWRKAEALGMPVLIHPVLVGPAPRAAKFGLAQVAQYTFDTTLGIGSVLMSGVLDRFPGLKLVLSHGGGAYPYLAGRFDIMHRRMDRAAQGDVAAKAAVGLCHADGLRQHRPRAESLAVSDRSRRT